MAETITSVFERLGSGLAINKALIDRLHHFERSFANRSKDHCEFLGGNLMGVHPFRFLQADRDDWFDEVLEMDELDLQEAIAKTESYNPEWKRASDVMNLSIVWLLHVFHKANLPIKEKQDGMLTALLILQYKFLASLMAHNFPYVADRQTMEAAYASLSKRYSLKVAGSWYKLLEERGKEIISPSGIWKRTYESFNNDKQIIDMVEDIQGRLRKIVKALTAVFYEIRAKGGRINVSKAIFEGGGEKFIPTSTRDSSAFLRYIHEVAPDASSFVRAELVELVCDIQHTLPSNVLEECLLWISINHGVKITHLPIKVDDNQLVSTLLDEVVLHAVNFALGHPGLLTKRSGLGKLLQQLRAVYMASRMSDPSLLRCKELADAVVSRSATSRNSAVIASARTGIQIYIVARALTMEHYS